jgi:hypothetical protein
MAEKTRTLTEAEVLALDRFIDAMDDFVFEEQETKESLDATMNKAFDLYIELRGALAAGSVQRLREGIAIYAPELVPKLGDLVAVKQKSDWVKKIVDEAKYILDSDRKAFEEFLKEKIKEAMSY